MKQTNKLFSLLLAVVMIAVMLPSFLASEPLTVEAASVGTIMNGGFENGLNDWEVTSVPPTHSSDRKKSGSYSARFSNHSSLKNAKAMEQIVPVNKNGEYTFSFYHYTPSGSGSDIAIKWSLSLSKNESFTGVENTDYKYIVKDATDSSYASWERKYSTTFQTGEYKYFRIQFYYRGTGVDDIWVDDVALATVNSGDSDTHEGPDFMRIGTDKNRPKSSKNIVTNSNLESSSSGQWNTSTFIKGNLSTATDATSPAGSKVLHYKNTASTGTWHTFEVSLPAAGEYVLSAWLKMPLLSSTATGRASIGIVDKAGTGTGFIHSSDSEYYLKQSDTKIALRPTATDGKWHLRSMVFFVNAAKKVTVGVYGEKSELWIDAIAVYALDDGETYYGDMKTGTATVGTASSNIYCASEDNLIPDCNMNTSRSKTFWTESSAGWNNGVMAFADGGDGHGNAIKFESQNSGLYFIKWVYVTPHTDYTVSFDYKVTKSGDGKLQFLDNNIELPKAIKTLEFDSAQTSWKTYSFTVNSGPFGRIAFAFYDENRGGSSKATAYFDDIRFFESAKGIASEPAEELDPTLRHTGGESSQMEMKNPADGYGVAFRLQLKVKNVSLTGYYNGDLTNATVDAYENGGAQKLIRMGAVMTNNPAIGSDASRFNLDNLNSNGTVIDIEAKKLYEIDSNTAKYAVRIKNIPAGHKDDAIYARPYYVFEDASGKQITVYGDIYSDTAAGLPDINDGWLEWD